VSLVVSLYYTYVCLSKYHSALVGIYGYHRHRRYELEVAASGGPRAGLSLPLLVSLSLPLERPALLPPRCSLSLYYYLLPTQIIPECRWYLLHTYSLLGFTQIILKTLVTDVDCLQITINVPFEPPCHISSQLYYYIDNRQILLLF